MELTRLTGRPSPPLAIVDGEVKSCVQMAKIRAFCKSFMDQCPRDPLLEEGSLNCFVVLLRQLFIHLNNRKLELSPEEREIVVKEIHEALDYFSIQTSNFDSPEFSTKCTVEFCKNLFHALVTGREELEKNYSLFLQRLAPLDPSLRVFFYTALYYDADSEHLKNEITILVLREISALSRHEPIHRTLNRLWLSVPIAMITDLAAATADLQYLETVNFSRVYIKAYSEDGKTFAQNSILQEVCDLGLYRVDTLIATSYAYAINLANFVKSGVMFPELESLTQDRPDYTANVTLFNLINSTFEKAPDNTIVPEGLEERLEEDEEFCVISALASASFVFKDIKKKPAYKYQSPSILEAVYVLDLYMLHCDPRKLDEPTFLRIIGHPNFANVKSKSDLRRLAITADALGLGEEKRAMVARVFKNANKPIMEFAATCCLQPPENESVLGVIAKKALVKEFFPEHTITNPYNGKLATIAVAYEEFTKLLQTRWCSDEILAMLKRNLHVWILETLAMAAKDTDCSSALGSLLVILETRVKPALVETGFRQNYIIAVMGILQNLKGRPFEILRKSEILSLRCFKTLKLEKNQLRVVVLDMLQILIEASAIAEESEAEQRLADEVALYAAALRELSKDRIVPREGITLPALLSIAEKSNVKLMEARVMKLEQALTASDKRLAEALETAREKQVMAEQKSLLFQQEWDKSAVENKRLTDEIAKTKAKLEKLSAKLQGSATTIESQKVTLRRVEMEHSKQVHRLEKQIEDLKRILAEEQEALTQQISELQAKLTKLESQNSEAKELPEECVEELLTTIEMTLPTEPVILDPAWCKSHDIQGITGLCDRETITTYLRDHKQIPKEEIRKGIIPLPFLKGTLQAIEGTAPEKVYFHTPLGAIPVINALDRIINLTGPLTDKIARLPLSNGEQWRYDDLVARLSLEQQVDLRRLLRQPIPANLLGAAAIDRVIADLRAIAEAGIKLCLLAAVKKGHHPLMENPPERGSILRDSHRIVTLMRIAAREFNITREFKDDIDRLDRAGMEYYKREYPVRDESAPELLAVMHNITKRLAESPSEDGIAALATSFSQDVMPAMIHLLETVTKLMGRA